MLFFFHYYFFLLKDYGEIPAYLLRRKGKHPKSLDEKSMIEVTKPEEPEIENLTEEECREIIEVIDHNRRKMPDFSSIFFYMMMFAKQIKHHLADFEICRTNIVQYNNITSLRVLDFAKKNPY